MYQPRRYHSAANYHRDEVQWNILALQEKLASKWHPKSYEEYCSVLIHDFDLASRDPEEYLEHLQTRLYFHDLIDNVFKKGVKIESNKTSQA